MYLSDNINWNSWSDIAVCTLSHLNLEDCTPVCTQHLHNSVYPDPHSTTFYGVIMAYHIIFVSQSFIMQIV